MRITLINILYTLWPEIMTRRISPFTNMITAEQQTAYRHGRSTIDILSLIQNSIQNDKTQQLILVGLSKSFDSIDRNTMWAIMYQQGTPLDMVEQLKMGHTGTRLCAKHAGCVGTSIYNNKGVSQGSPISAHLFIIYLDTVIRKYEQQLPGQVKIHRGNWMYEI